MRGFKEVPSQQVRSGLLDKGRGGGRESRRTEPQLFVVVQSGT